MVFANAHSELSRGLRPEGAGIPDMVFTVPEKVHWDSLK